ncbi:endochitinase 33 [Naviculisporaceae sp. PSN 640]
MMSSAALALFGAVLSFIPATSAGFTTGSDNVVIYWGQNSAGQAQSQQRLATYCSNTNLDVIPLAFLHSIKNPTLLNFASASDKCTTFPGTQLLKCPEIEADIKACQNQGKTIILSIGGATYTEGGFSSAAEAQQWANTLWAMFGPQQSGSNVNRPFGSAVIDGFDIDVEASAANLVAFAGQLRVNLDSATTNTKKYILAAAPQCPFPDHANQAMLDAVKFDYVAVQFYNNYCGAQSYVPGAPSQNNFNFETWDNWAKTTSKNPNVKILLGVPGSPTAAGGGYVSGSQLTSVINYSKRYSSFGGVMVWDMSQVFNNNGFLDTVVSALDIPGGTDPITTTRGPITTTLTTITKTTTAPITTTTPGPGTVPQWGQCGGKGYDGPTECIPPFKCRALSEWWSQCE